MTRKFGYLGCAADSRGARGRGASRGWGTCACGCRGIPGCLPGITPVNPWSAQILFVFNYYVVFEMDLCE